MGCGLVGRASPPPCSMHRAEGRAGGAEVPPRASTGGGQPVTRGRPLRAGEGVLGTEEQQVMSSPNEGAWPWPTDSETVGPAPCYCPPRAMHASTSPGTRVMDGQGQCDTPDALVQRPGSAVPGQRIHLPVATYTWDTELPPDHPSPQAQGRPAQWGSAGAQLRCDPARRRTWPLPLHTPQHRPPCSRGRLCHLPADGPRSQQTSCGELGWVPIGLDSDPEQRPCGPAFHISSPLESPSMKGPTRPAGLRG